MTFPEEKTNPSVPRLRALTDPPESETMAVEPKTEAELLGQVMAATARNEATLNAMALDLGTLTREFSEHVRNSVEHKDEIKEATTKAAAHGSNRLALLFGALLTIYEISAPALHELAKWVQR